MESLSSRLSGWKYYALWSNVPDISLTVAEFRRFLFSGPQVPGRLTDEPDVDQGDQLDQVLNEVSTVLWRERQLLELLVFKLEEEQLLLNAGKSRWVNHASREVEIVLDQLRAAELLRAVKVEAAAEELGLPSYPGLRSLSKASPEPWSSIFARHRQAFLELTSEVRDLSELNRHLLAKGRDAAREALNWLTGNSGPPAQAYTSAGIASQAPTGHLLVNEAI
jgi:hypothetical protein